MKTTLRHTYPPIMAEVNYFAAANTAAGFVNLFPETLAASAVGPGDRLYIIKGGPGTGKSYLMQQVANEGSNRGMRVERMLCSSDPASLDGVRITDPASGRTLSVVDGTAPHICDPILPGAYDSIIHLGDFWNGELLRGRFDELTRLNEQKKALYALAYRYLAAAGEAHAGCCRYACGAYLAGKARDAALRMLRWAEKDGAGGERRLFTESIGMDGVCRLTDLYRADRVYVLEDRYGVGGPFMEALTAAAAGGGRAQVTAGHLLAPHLPSTLYLPEQGGGESAAFILCDRTGLTAAADEVLALSPHAKRVNLARFLDASVLTGRQSTVRSRYRFAARLRSELTDAALDTFSRIKDAHHAIEQIYGAAMDFGKKEAYTKRLLIKMFGEA